MTYADRVREEILTSNPSKGPCYPAFCYGLLLMGRQFDGSGVATTTEHLAVSKLYGFAIRDLIGVRAAFSQERRAPRGQMLYTVSLPDPRDAARLLRRLDHHPDLPNRALMEGENAHAFLAGAFLACGTVSEPSKSYHLEFMPPDESLCDLLFEALSLAGYPPKTIDRRNATVLYFKESEQIEDLLTMAGATGCSLELMELKIYKDLRNRANRATNCETANIDKLVRASRQQMDDIDVLCETGTLERLSPQLRAMAELRRAQPDASLAQLAELSGVSRSGVNHRLARLGEAAARVRREGNDIHG